jgi:hypothetical protein
LVFKKVARAAARATFGVGEGQNTEGGKSYQQRSSSLIRHKKNGQLRCESRLPVSTKNQPILWKLL